MVRAKRIPKPRTEPSMNQDTLAIFMNLPSHARSRKRSIGVTQMLVQVPNGECITIEADVEDTIDDVKAKIQNRLGYDMTYYRLMKPLEGWRTIEEYQSGTWSSLAGKSLLSIVSLDVLVMMT